jgi:signal transduction histidine kinase
VSIESTNAHVELTIEDDGRGFEPEAAAREGHFGLTMLADVTSELGGRLDLRSSPGAGTLVRVDVPR